MIQAVIFDLDDTIWNYTEADTFACTCVFNMMRSLMKEEYPHLDVLYKKIVTDLKSSNNINNKHNKMMYFKRMFEQLNIPLPFLSNIIEEYYSRFMSSLCISKGVHELFLLLKRNHIKIGVLSNNHFDEQYHRLEMLSLISFIDVIVTTDEIGEEKPSILPFLDIIHKLNVSPENIIMIGDNIHHDMIPARIVKIGLCLLYDRNHTCPMTFRQDMNVFQNFHTLYEWIHELFLSIPLYKHLCGYFSQSFQNVQGTGGNISIKLPYNTLIIKTSGSSLGDSNEYCIVNQITQEKIMGKGKPSMEIGFHCNISSQIVIHLHFLPMNRYLCCDRDKLDLVDFEKPYFHIPYLHPGEELSQDIKSLSFVDDSILFLQNHGIILCGSSIDNIYDLYKYLFKFCDDRHVDYRLYEFYDRVKDKLGGNFVYSVEMSCLQYYIRHIKYCFPDMVIFLQNIDDENRMTKNSDIVISQDKDVYIIASCVKEYRSKLEVLHSYIEICKYNYDNLVEIDDIQSLISMPIEIERKKKNRI
jgi:putative hydrolase of the HAD superfamily